MLAVDSSDTGENSASHNISSLRASLINWIARSVHSRYIQVKLHDVVQEEKRMRERNLKRILGTCLLHV